MTTTASKPHNEDSGTGASAVAEETLAGAEGDEEASEEQLAGVPAAALAEAERPLTLELADLLTGSTMVRRLPSLIRRTISTAVFALRSAATGLQGLVGYGRDLLRTGLYLDDWERFANEAAGQRLDRGTIAPRRPKHIDLRQVTFC